MTKTKIEWADRVWNPVTGCTKVSEGCRNCYAERLAKRFWGERKFTDVQCHPDRLRYPRSWTNPSLVFVNSMSDLFHPDVPFEFVTEVWITMGLAKKHTFMILTKRPSRMIEFLEFWKEESKQFYNFNVLQNVWLGVSVEDQMTADERIPLLLQTPAAVRFVSCEPLLGPVDLTQINCESFRQFNALNSDHGFPGMPGERNRQIDWVISGGESGPYARPMHPDWARYIRNQCKYARVPFFFKQFGEWVLVDRFDYHGKMKSMVVPGEKQFRFDWFSWVGKKVAGRLLDGQEWNQFPGDVE